MYQMPPLPRRRKQEFKYDDVFHLLLILLAVAFVWFQWWLFGELKVF